MQNKKDKILGINIIDSNNDINKINELILKQAENIRGEVIQLDTNNVNLFNPFDECFKQPRKEAIEVLRQINKSCNGVLDYDFLIDISSKNGFNITEEEIALILK